MKVNKKTKEIWRPDLHTEKKRRKLLVKLANGKILDIGYNEFPNDFLKGAVGFDKDVVRIPKNYTRLVKGDCQKLSKYFPVNSRCQAFNCTVTWH